MSQKEYSTILSELRTLLALERNALAEERTAFAELRTGLALLALSPSISAIIAIFFDLGNFPLLLFFSFISLAVVGLILSVHAQSRLTALRKRKVEIIDQELLVIQKSPEARKTFDRLIKANIEDVLS